MEGEGGVQEREFCVESVMRLSQATAEQDGVYRGFIMGADRVAEGAKRVRVWCVGEGVVRQETEAQTD